MGGVDHDPVGFASSARQFSEDTLEHIQPAPANEALVDRLMRTATLGRDVITKSKGERPSRIVVDPHHYGAAGFNDIATTM